MVTNLEFSAQKPISHLLKMIERSTKAPSVLSPSIYNERVQNFLENVWSRIQPDSICKMRHVDSMSIECKGSREGGYGGFGSISNILNKRIGISLHGVLFDCRPESSEEFLCLVDRNGERVEFTHNSPAETEDLIIERFLPVAPSKNDFLSTYSIGTGLIGSLFFGYHTYRAIQDLNKLSNVTILNTQEHSEEANRLNQASKSLKNKVLVYGIATLAFTFFTTAAYFGKN